ncbi:hypothetical protein MTO96_013236 [Rhipicephalus appendiculatus]
MMRFIPTPGFSPRCLPLGNLSIIDKGLPPPPPPILERAPHPGSNRPDTHSRGPPPLDAGSFISPPPELPHKAPRVRVAGGDTAVTQARRPPHNARAGDNGTRQHSSSPAQRRRGGKK